MDNDKYFDETMEWVSGSPTLLIQYQYTYPRPSEAANKAGKLDQGGGLSSLSN